MAETAVSVVIEHLVPLLEAEVKLLKGVRGEVEGIKAELLIIQPFLRDADERAERGVSSDGVAAWVRQVRQVSYQIEDVIDEYILHLAQRAPRHGVLVGCLHKVGHLIKNLKPRHEIATQIEDIKKTLQQIHDLQVKYGLQAIEEGSCSTGHKSVTWNDPRVASLFIEDAELVGIESPRDELMSRMAEEASSKRTVTSVVGGGGLGKTTLVKKVYDSQIRTSMSIVCHAWITVSESYKIEELLRTLIKQFYQTTKDQTSASEAVAGIETMDSTALIALLKEYLQQKRYVVVFDDVWDSNLWKTIKLALPDKNNGSRIIFTTRDANIASSCKESAFDHVQELQPLPDQVAWELFCKKAFIQNENEIGRCPEELVELAKSIVKKCCGVPLAIVAIGGVLASKEMVVSKWKIFHDSLGSELESNRDLQDVKQILSLSYVHLPYFLKPCFLYFGIFPEDHSISCVRLVRLWIAEGFVKTQRGKTLEETAQEYLTELIRRSLVQVSRLDFDGKVRTCRVHDLMREIILSKFQDLNFCRILGGEDCLFNSQSRRLSINRQADQREIGDNITSNGNGRTIIRSIFVFQTSDLPESFVATIIANFKLLKVMDLEGAPLKYLPEGVGDLVHLRYLSVRNTKVKRLPRSIARLRFLMTLDLKMSEVSILPVEISRLHKLRHLLASRYDDDGDRVQGVKIGWEGLGCLEGLQKLYFVEANGVIKDVGKLKQLRKLGITKLRRQDGKPLCAALEKMIHLESLDVGSDENEILDLQHLSSPPPFLQRLYLQGRLERLPNWISKLENLTRIGLYGSGLTEDSLHHLQGLPRLLEFGLYRGAYEGKSLCFEAAGFQKLKVIKLRDLKLLNSVTIQEGALPALDDATYGECPRLMDIPYNFAEDKLITEKEFIEELTKWIASLRASATASASASLSCDVQVDV